MGEGTRMTGPAFYYCHECALAYRSEDVYLEWRVARQGAWGCGSPSCDRCYETRETPLAICPTCATKLSAISDDDVDPEIFDYLAPAW